MSKNPPTVTVQSDDHRKRQWGLGWLFREDGKKTVLDSRRAKAVLISLFTLLGLVHLLFDRSEGHEQANDTVPLPTEVKLVEISTEAFPKAVSRMPPSSTNASDHKSVKKYSGPLVISRPRRLEDIPPGSLLEAKLITGASDGMVKAQVTRELRIKGENIIEKGTVLIGVGQSSEQRLLVQFNQVIFRDGTVAPFRAHACDKEDKILGLKGSKIGTKALNIAGSVGLGLVGGISEGLQETQGQFGAVIRKPSLKNALLNATATTALEQSRHLMDDLKEHKTTFEVAQGTEICVITGASDDQ